MLHLLLLNMALCGLTWQWWQCIKTVKCSHIWDECWFRSIIVSLNVYKWTLHTSYRGPLLGFMFLQDKIINIYVMQNKWPALCTCLFNMFLKHGNDINAIKACNKFKRQSREETPNTLSVLCSMKADSVFLAVLNFPLCMKKESNHNLSNAKAIF